MNVRSLAFLASALALPLIPHAAPAADAPATVPLVDRVTIATQLYNSISTYYAHWKGAPDFNLDDDYKVYLDRILSSDDRRNFSLASEAFIARLNNGYSNFYDKYLYEAFRGSLGLYARPLQGNWVVFMSRIDLIKPGDVIRDIDGQDFNAFFKANRQYVSGSSDADRAAHFFYHPYLFPQTFVVGLDDGRTVTINCEYPLILSISPFRRRTESFISGAFKPTDVNTYLREFRE